MNIENEITDKFEKNDYENLLNIYSMNIETINFDFKAKFLTRLIMLNNTYLLNSLLNFEKDINFFDKNKRSLLMYACLINDNKIFDIILNKKQNYEFKDNLSNNALHYAVKFYGMKRNLKNLYKIEKLIKLININSVNFFNQTPLIFAAIYNDENIVELLCKNGADPNIGNGWGDFTPLMTAVRMNKIGLVKTIIEKNVDIQSKNRFTGYTALDIADAFNFKEIKDVLVNKLNEKN